MVERGTSRGVQWLRSYVSKVGGTGSIPGWGTKISQAAQHGKKKKNTPKAKWLKGSPRGGENIGGGKQPLHGAETNILCAGGFFHPCSGCLIRDVWGVEIGECGDSGRFFKFREDT